MFLSNIFCFNPYLLAFSLSNPAFFTVVRNSLLSSSLHTEYVLRKYDDRNSKLNGGFEWKKSYFVQPTPDRKVTNQVRISQFIMCLLQECEYFLQKSTKSFVHTHTHTHSVAQPNFVVQALRGFAPIIPSYGIR